MVEIPRLQAGHALRCGLWPPWSTGGMKHYRHGAHTKYDLKVHLVWVPKYRKHVLIGEVAIRVRDVLRQIASEHELAILSGKVAKDHVHLLISYHPR